MENPEKIVLNEKIEEVRYCGAYSSNQIILIIGDGDFSFSLSLCRKLKSGSNLVATSYDSFEILEKKYPECPKFLEEIQESGAIVRHNVDAADLQNTLILPTEFCTRKYDRIIFQFPLVYSQRDYESFKADPDNTIRNRRLLREFFHSSIPFLTKDGEIHISSKETRPYNEWNIQGLATGMEPFGFLQKYDFNKEDFPEYKCKNVGCNDAFPLTNATTFVYGIPQEGKEIDKSEFIYDKKIYPYVCLYCRKKSTNELDKENHERSKDHKRAVKLYENWQIEVEKIDNKWKERKKKY